MLDRGRPQCDQRVRKSEHEHFQLVLCGKPHHIPNFEQSELVDMIHRNSGFLTTQGVLFSRSIAPFF